MSPLDYAHPDYAPIWRERMARLARLQSIPGAIEACRQHYREHVADFIMDWGCTVDPRNPALGLPVVMPFVLFPKQIEFIEWVLERWRKNENGVLVKSRDCGASWLAMSISVTLCLFWEGISIGFGSATEDKVDDSGNPDTLFYKGRMFMRYLPKEFRGTWDSRKKDNSGHMKLLFPDTNSSITGDGGDNIGLGGRKTIYWGDEFAVVQRAKLVETNLSANTNCFIALSTVRGIDNVFAELARGGKRPRFDFSYLDDPRKVNHGAAYDTTITDEDGTVKAVHVKPGDKQPWFAKHIADMDPVIFNQEYGCDFLASIEGGVLEVIHIHAAIGIREKLGLPEPTGPWTASFDVADLGTDKNAVCVRHGIELAHVEEWSGSNINPMISIRRAFDICDRFGVRELAYDASGMGGSWHEYFAMVNEERKKNGQKPIVVVKFQGGGAVLDPERKAPGSDRKNKDFYENYKAQSWMAFRMRFVESYKASCGEKYDPEKIISISPAIGKMMTKFTGELAQPTRQWSKNGKLMIDKTPDDVASPNMADAGMMAFGYVRPPWVFPPELLERV